MIPPGDTELFEPDESTIMVPPDPLTELAARAGCEKSNGTAAPTSKKDEYNSSLFEDFVLFMVPRLSKPEWLSCTVWGKRNQYCLPGGSVSIGNCCPKFRSLTN